MTGWDREKNQENGSNQQLQSFNSSIFQSSKTVTKYLPKGADWYDFWTGQRYKGGQNVKLTTTLQTVPMFVRAGSILPLGPEMQYVGEKAWDNLEMRVYPGADGMFTLYEDEGDNYNYEKGVYSTITFKWNDRTRTLTIGDRQGSYPGMLQTRKFTVVLPNGTKQTVDYSGAAVTVTL
jgi:alpha-D-xyloside xylohydrolase